MIFKQFAQRPRWGFADAVEEIARAGIISDVSGIGRRCLKEAKKRKKTLLQNDPLSTEGIAFVMMYSGDDVFQHLNAKSNTDRIESNMRPYGPYVVSFLKHMRDIPAYPDDTVYRGVKKNLRARYRKGDVITWHGFSSTSKTIETVNAFCGTTGKRTIFNIKLTQGQARDVSQYSEYPREDEVLLPPGCRFHVVSASPQGDLTIIQLQEIESNEWIIDLRPRHKSRSPSTAARKHKPAKHSVSRSPSPAAPKINFLVKKSSFPSKKPWFNWRPTEWYQVVCGAIVMVFGSAWVGALIYHVAQEVSTGDIDALCAKPSLRHGELCRQHQSSANFLGGAITFFGAAYKSCISVANLTVAVYSVLFRACKLFAGIILAVYGFICWVWEWRNWILCASVATGLWCLMNNRVPSAWIEQLIPFLACVLESL